MNIYEAVKACSVKYPFMTRDAWRKVVSTKIEDSVKIQPTETPEGCLFYGLSQKAPIPGWQPRKEDLLATDWMVVMGGGKIYVKKFKIFPKTENPYV